MKKQIFMLIVMLMSIAICQTECFAKKEKKTSNSFASKGEKFRMDCTFVDWDDNGTWDHVYILIFHWDGSKWYQCGDKNVPIRKINTSSNSTDLERIELCNSISKPGIETLIAFPDSSVSVDLIQELPFTMYFYDSLDSNSQDIAYLDIIDSEAFLNGYFTQAISEEVEINMLAKTYFPNENINYTKEDMIVKINEYVINNQIDMYFGSLVVRLLAEIEIYDINNELVKTEIVNNRQLLNIDVTDLPNNIYHVRIKDIDGAYWTLFETNILIAR